MSRAQNGYAHPAAFLACPECLAAWPRQNGLRCFETQLESSRPFSAHRTDSLPEIAARYLLRLLFTVHDRRTVGQAPDAASKRTSVPSPLLSTLSLGQTRTKMRVDFSSDDLSRSKAGNYAALLDHVRSALPHEHTGERALGVHGHEAARADAMTCVLHAARLPSVLWLRPPALVTLSIAHRMTWHSNARMERRQRPLHRAEAELCRRSQGCRSFRFSPKSPQALLPVRHTMMILLQAMLLTSSLRALSKHMLASCLPESSQIGVHRLT